MYDSFESRLKMLRKEKGDTQETLGYAVDVNRTAVANWENGIRRPSLLTIRKLALYFNVSTDYLCGRTNDRRQATIAPVSEIDLAKLNRDGLKLPLEFYRFLESRPEYCTDLKS